MNCFGGRLHRLRVPSLALYIWKYRGGVHFYGNFFGGAGTLDKDVSGFYCVIKRVIACSLVVRSAWARHERQLPFLLLLVSTISGQGLNPTVWSVVRRATKKPNTCTVDRAQIGPIPTTRTRCTSPAPKPKGWARSGNFNSKGLYIGTRRESTQQILYTQFDYCISIERYKFKNSKKAAIHSQRHATEHALLSVLLGTCHGPQVETRNRTRRQPTDSRTPELVRPGRMITQLFQEQPAQEPPKK